MSGGAAGADDRYGAPYRREHAPRPVGGLRLWRPRRAGAGGAGAGGGGRPGRGDRRGRAPCTSVRSRDARPRPRDPHQRRAARVQLPALAGGLRRIPLHARPLARLRRGAAGGGAVGLCDAPAAVRQAVSGLVGRVLIAVPLIAMHEYGAATRSLRPLTIAGFAGVTGIIVVTHQGGLVWSLAALMGTLLLAFWLSAVADV